MDPSVQIQNVESVHANELVIDLGNAADLTLGGSSGGREDKRYEVA